jgi:hypothetical protein
MFSLVLQFQGLTPYSPVQSCGCGYERCRLAGPQSTPPPRFDTPPGDPLSVLQAEV